MCGMQARDGLGSAYTGRVILLKSIPIRSWPTSAISTATYTCQHHKPQQEREGLNARVMTAFPPRPCKLSIPELQSGLTVLGLLIQHSAVHTWGKRPEACARRAQGEILLGVIVQAVGGPVLPGCLVLLGRVGALDDARQSHQCEFDRLSGNGCGGRERCQGGGCPAWGAPRSCACPCQPDHPLQPDAGAHSGTAARLSKIAVRLISRVICTGILTAARTANPSECKPAMVVPA